MVKVPLHLFAGLLILCWGNTLVHAQVPATNAPPLTNAPAAEQPPAKDNPVEDLLTDAHALSDKGDHNGALTKINAALQIDPKNARAFVLRASIYGAQHLWNRAQSDYEAALASGTAQNPAIIKFNLAELQFQQRRFENARPGFLALESDPELGDLVAYKVFLCDLMSNRIQAANKELADFNAAARNPSYYYSNAAYDLAHNRAEEARGWLGSASHIYSPVKNNLYMASLLELGHVDAPAISFTTQKGKTYTEVQVSVEDDGLHVLSQDGLVTVPFDQLPANLSTFPGDLRKQIEARRSPIPGSIGTTVALLTTKQGRKYQNVVVFVENTGLRLHTADGWVSVPFDQLSADLSDLPSDLQKQIASNRLPPPDPSTGIQVAHLVTKQGDHYDHVAVIVEEADLRVHTATGWIGLPFDSLPDDLSGLPDDLQRQITAKRAPLSNAAAGIPVEHLETLAGQKYDKVQVFVEASGLRVRTASGLVSIPFEQLPQDLSALPADLQQQIAAQRRPLTNTASGIKLPSLTTKAGKTYKDADVFVEDGGLRLRTTDGFTNISFDQLPDDISSFPPELQRQIAAKRPQVSDSVSGINVPTLTTKSGQTYTNISVFVENDGLRFKTADGWVTVPFSHLPQDQSALPADLRRQIGARQVADPR